MKGGDREKEKERNFCFFCEGERALCECKKRGVAVEEKRKMGAEFFFLFLELILKFSRKKKKLFPLAFPPARATDDPLKISK